MFRAILALFCIHVFVSSALSADSFEKNVNAASLIVRQDFYDLAQNDGCNDLEAFFDARLKSQDEALRFASQAFIILHMYHEHEIPECTMTQSLLARAAIEHFETVTDVSNLSEANNAQKRNKRLQSRSRLKLMEALKQEFGSEWLTEAAKTLKPPLAMENAFSNLICSDLGRDGAGSILEDLLLDKRSESNSEARFQMLGLKKRLQRNCARELEHATEMEQKTVCMWIYFAQENTKKLDYLHFPPSMENLYKSYGVLNRSSFERLLSVSASKAEFAEKSFLQEFPSTSKIGLVTRRMQLYFIKKIVEICETRFSEPEISEIQAASRSVKTYSMEEFGLRFE